MSTSGPPGAFDPYAPPAAAPVPPPRRRSSGALVVYVFGALEVVHYPVAASWGYLGFSPESYRSVGIMGMVVSILFSLAGIAWITETLKRLPERLRDERFAGVNVLGRFFIPIYNMVWMFVVTTGLCALLDKGLAGHGKPATAPRQLALHACCAHIGIALVTRVVNRSEEPSPLAYIGVVVPVLWTLFTFRVEAAMRDLEDAIAAEA